jgi:hypothetical protein
MIWKPHQAEKEVFWQNLNALGFIKVVSYDFVILISRPSIGLEELIILFGFSFTSMDCTMQFLVFY